MSEPVAASEILLGFQGGLLLSSVPEGVAAEFAALEALTEDAIRRALWAEGRVRAAQQQLAEGRGSLSAEDVTTLERVVAGQRAIVQTLVVPLETELDRLAKLFSPMNPA